MRIRLQPNKKQKQKKTSDRFKSLSYPTKTNAVFSWIECVVLRVQPFCFVENLVYRQHFKQDFISSKTFIKYFQLLTEHVEKKVKEILSDKFPVFFNCWSGGGTDYIAVFAYFPSNYPNGYEKLLLGVSAMEH